MKPILTLIIFLSCLTAKAEKIEKNLTQLLDDFASHANVLRENGKLTEKQQEDFESIYPRTARRPQSEFDEKIKNANKLELRELMILTSALAYSPYAKSSFSKYLHLKEGKIALLTTAAYIERFGPMEDDKFHLATKRASELAKSADTTIASIATLSWSSALKSTGKSRTPAIDSAKIIFKQLRGKTKRTQAEAELLPLMKMIMELEAKEEAVHPE